MGTGAVKRDTLDELVVAFCRDRARRIYLREKSHLSKRTMVELRYLDYRIEEAAREIVGDKFDIYLSEIANAVGYAKSEAANVSESVYKLNKARIKGNIARKLHLTD